MKKLLIFAAIMFISGIAVVFSDETAPEPKQQTTEVPQVAPVRRPMNPLAAAMRGAKGRRTATPAASSQQVATPSGESGKGPPVRPNQNQLISRFSSQSSQSLAETPAQNGQAQLIRNLPYQSNSATSQSPATSNKPTASSGSQPNPSAGSNTSRSVACVVRGFVEGKMTSDECKAKGGKEVENFESTNTVSSGAAQKS